ncbi:phospholipase D family protein [Algoriphagus aestuariicola]
MQFHKRIKDHIQNLNIQKRDIRIVYRESKLQLEESNWLESQVGVRTSICPTLHSKCYINENEAIVTSMNLYSFSQQNNDEMGILVRKEDDPDLYKDIYTEATRLLTISEEIRVSVTKVEKKPSEPKIEIESSLNERVKDYSKTSLKTTKELSEITGLSSRKINECLSDNKLMYKKEEDWIATKKGIELGGISKAGQYGKFIVWPEELAKEIK